MRRAILVVVLVLVSVFLLVACSGQPSDVILPKNEKIGSIKVEWQEINSPPGVSGTCWAFFLRQDEYSEGYGYSGVYCQETVAAK